MNCTPEQARKLLHDLKAAWNALPANTRPDCRYILQDTAKDMSGGRQRPQAGGQAMIRRCGWCHQFLGFKHGNGITDGICPTCKSEKDRELEELYADISAPAPLTAEPSGGSHPCGALRGICFVVAFMGFWTAIAIIIWFAWRQG